MSLLSTSRVVSPGAFPSLVYFFLLIEIYLAKKKKIVNGVKTPKTIEEMDDEDKKRMSLNAKAKNVLTCALGKNEYSRVSSCASEHEM